MILNKTVLTSSVIVVIGAYLIYYNLEYFNNQISSYFHKDPIVKMTYKNIFTEEDLARFNGNHEKKLYLAILGNVFDVSKGRKHYEKGNGYHYFIGKDGSRSFISGDFADESADKDHVIDLECKELDILTNWVKTYKTTYTYKGKLLGRYYDKYGKETLYRKQLTEKIDKCQLEKLNEHELKLQYPPCNIEWSAETGTRVWCTKSSGGVSRDWVGVPRKQFNPGQPTPKCICVDTSKEYSISLLEEYENCLPDAVSCKIKS